MSPDMTPASLSIAIVTYAPDERLLARTLASTADAIALARERGSLGATRLQIVDNGPEGLAPMLAILGEAALARAQGTTLEVISGHGNVGFGRGHNLAIAASTADFHLVLNPDVELDRDALDAALRYLDAHPEVGALTPSVHGADGKREYLVKTYPSPGVLFVRGFVPRFLHGLFRESLDVYELRHLDWEKEQSPVTIASGCFLCCRSAALNAVKGFDPGYFLYFEDFDLTLRLSKVSTVAYCPQVRIVHHGGQAASKGLKHIAWFVKSARRFFATHGRAPGA
ncbi:MAG: glycosyltransferase family 2 protein [Betaproteobacteria bacterium]|nr:glycosyltransferase family 2 protein [Betaproteobacteria bacterium]